MKAVMIEKNGSIGVSEQPIPLITEANQVLVKVTYSGVCGSDLPRIFAQGAHFYPITLGHEFSGYVVDMGEAVTDLRVNDGVACVPLLPCFECAECQHGYYSLCKQYQFVGSRSHGGNAEYIVVQRNNIFKLPENVSLLEGAFFEPITVGLHALLLAGGCEGKHVTIVGAGTIGLLAMQCAKAMGAISLTIIDINDEKLVLAKQLGADYVYNSAEYDSVRIHQLMSDHRFEQLILETAGTPQTVELCLRIAGPRAKIALVGTLHRDLSLSQEVFGLILRKELTLLGSWMNYSNDWPGEEWRLAAQLFQDKKITLSPLTASINDFDDYVKTVTELHGQPMNGKILLKM